MSTAVTGDEVSSGVALPRTRPGFLACVRRDIHRLVRGRPSFLHALGLVLTNRGLQAVLLYRISRALWLYRVPILPLVFTRAAQHLFAVDISPKAYLGPGIVIVHGFGLVIGSDTVIEGDCTFFHGVTLGAAGHEWVGSTEPDGHPTVGREVMFAAGAKVLGPIQIGCNSVIGANAVVIRDVPPDSVVAGVPGRVIGRRPLPYWADSDPHDNLPGSGRHE